MPDGVKSITSTSARRALILLNPRASRAPESSEGLARMLREHALEADIHVLSRSTPARDVILQNHAGADIVVVAGGDGTLNSAVEGILRCGKPLGIIPIGTANDLARTLGIPEDIELAVSLLAHGARRRIDLGWVNGKHFFNAASIGMGVAVTRRLDRLTKRRWGILAYLKAFVQSLVSSRPFHASIRSNDFDHLGWTVQIVVANGPHYGGGMTLDDDARIDDGSLHVHSIEIRHWLDWVLLAPLLRIGRGRWSPDVFSADSTELTIVTRKPLPVSTDGEIVSRTPARFRVVRQALDVLVPSLPK